MNVTFFFTINLQWVSEHNDIPGNCEADELARTGTTAQPESEKEEICMPLATCRYLIDKHAIDIAESIKI